MKYRLSLFRGARDNAPTSVSFTWAEFVDALLPHEFKPADAKLQCDAFSPAVYEPGDTRADDNVIAFAIYAADLDHVSDAEFERFVELASGHGWAFVVYSTW